MINKKKDNTLLVMLFVDALSFDYISQEDMPHLYRLAQKGICSKVTTEPLHVWSDMVFTGCYPATTKVPTTYVYDPDNSPYKIIRHLTPACDCIDNTLKRWYIGRMMYRKMIDETLKIVTSNYMVSSAKAPYRLLTSINAAYTKRPCAPYVFNVDSIFDVFRKKGKVFMWDGITNARTSLLKTIRNQIGVNCMEHIYNRLFDTNPFKAQKYIMKEIEKKNLDFLFVSLGHLDWCVHTYGLYNTKIKRKLREVDTFVQHTYELISRNYDDFALIVNSDHGMNAIKGSVDILNILKKNGLHQHKDFIAWIDSESVRFWFFSEGDQARVRTILDSIEHGYIWTKKELRKYHRPSERHLIGDILFMMEPGWIILPNCFQNDSHLTVKAMHGYEPNDEQYSAPAFLMSGPAIPKSHPKNIEQVDVAPTILDFFGLSFDHDIDGKSLIR